VQEPPAANERATTARERPGREDDFDDFDDEDVDTPFINLLMGPIGVALLGSLLWAMLIYYKQTEYSIIAMGLGILIGIEAQRTNFEGFNEAIACSVLLVASIFGGKMLGFSWHLHAAEEAWSSMQEYDPDAVAEMAEGYKNSITQSAKKLKAAGTTDIGISKFMRENGYTESENVPPTSAELTDFKDYTMPRILDAAEELSYGTDPMAVFEESVSAKFASSSTFDAVKANMHPWDLYFYAFGVIIVFGMVGYGVQFDGD